MSNQLTTPDTCLLDHNHIIHVLKPDILLIEKRKFGNGCTGQQRLHWADNALQKR